MLDKLLTLSPGQFEDAVADFLRARGYRDVERVGGSGDLGVDLLCRDAVGSLVAVQCKRYAPDRPIGSPAIQTFFGMVVRRRAERGIYATTSRYTAGAKNLAAELDIELVDGSELSRYFTQKWELERREREERERREREERERREREERERREREAREREERQREEIARQGDALVQVEAPAAALGSEAPLNPSRQVASGARQVDESRDLFRAAYISVLVTVYLIWYAGAVPEGVPAALELWDRHEVLAWLAVGAVIVWMITYLTYNDDEWAMRRYGTRRSVIHLGRILWLAALIGACAVTYLYWGRLPIVSGIGVGLTVMLFWLTVWHSESLAEYRKANSGDAVEFREPEAPKAIMTASWVSSVVAIGLLLYSLF